MRVLVTGGAGFIGSAVVRYLVTLPGWSVVNYDKLTYAGCLASVGPAADQPNYKFIRGDVCDAGQVLGVLRSEKIDAIMHLAAESHVDRSIDGPGAFIETNVIGTFRMLDAARTYWSELDEPGKSRFRLHHISTDEVFGDLPFDAGIFTEETPYAPSSPYSASKASSDHLVRAWHETYGLPVVLSNCSNNYGPCQFPEKLIPLVTLNALENKALPVYGAGANVRDWLHVDDHARALQMILASGRIGQSYNVGGDAERTNLEVVEMICDILDEKRPLNRGASRRDLIEFVTDRPGHDRRYAIDCSKIKRELGWKPSFTFEDGLRQTVEWYLERGDWWEPLRESRYAGDRLGKATG